FNGAQLNLKQLSVDDLVALHPSTNPAETEPPMVRCDAISAADLHLDMPQEDGGADVALKTLTLEGLGVEIIRYASGHTNIDQWSSPPAHEPEQSHRPGTEGAQNTKIQKEDMTAAPSAEITLHWRLDNLQIEGDSYVHFTDAAAESDISLKLSGVDLSLQDLDSSAPHTRNPLKLDASMGRFATLKADGSISLLASEPQGNLDLKLHGFQLYSIAPYVEEVIGARIEKGALDFDADASIENNLLKLDSQAKLRSFTLGDMTPEQQERISSNLGMPLSLALALLRDEDGDIHLDIPVSGDLASPDVGIAPVVRKALFGAVQETVKLALKPLGILSGAGKLLGLGGDLQLPPVEFPPAHATLENPPQTLEPLGDLLGKRPQLRVILSAPLTSADIDALQARVQEQDRDKQEKDKKKSAEDRKQELTQEQLQTLALPLLQGRLNGIKQWLLDHADVHNNQVLFTQPRLDPAAGKPRVEMHF
ncbi:MAG: DUF748 domain-containing protein, partial [Desulfuromonadaceae bacterium]